MHFNFATHLTLSLALAATPALRAQTPPAAAAQAPIPAAPAAFTQGELEQMLAPIALYPDALLSQMLMASTYPLEVVEAARWRKANASLKDKALEDALQKQSWDTSVKSLTAFPEVLERMNQDLSWTQKLGDAFLGQQKQLLDTVQTLRAKAQTAGNLKSNEQQTVKVETQESKQVIVIEPANPQIVYVPTYQPTVVYGGWGYPAYPPYYPPYWYPPVATPLVSGFFWGVGIAAGAALWGGVNWGGGDVNIDIDRHNTFNRTEINNSKWNHKAEHRGSVPYRDTASRDKFQGSDRQAAQARDQFRGRDDSLGGQGLQDRQGLQQARKDPAVRDAAVNRGGAQAGTRDGGADRGGAQAGTRDLGGGAGAGNRASTTPSRPAQADRGGAFAGGDGAGARAASNRGNSSLSSGAARSGGGAARGGGGGRGGGGRR
jgi:hypothetical protein